MVSKESFVFGFEFVELLLDTVVFLLVGSELLNLGLETADDAILLVRPSSIVLHSAPQRALTRLAVQPDAHYSNFENTPNIITFRSRRSI
jgi:hypothetical protein